MKNKSDFSKEDFPKITLPWLIIGISSMIMFVVFLIAMFFNFHTAWFFCAWMWVIACALIFDGVSRRKNNIVVGNISIIMGIISFIAGIMIINLQK